MKRKLIVANWKMNGSFEQASAWLKDFIAEFDYYYDEMQNVDSVVCPPVFLIDHIDGELLDNAFQKLETFMFEEHKKIEDFSEEELEAIVSSERPILLGAQDCHYESSGSFTGDISAEMLRSVGAEYVILGHSERRATHFESDATVAKKLTAASSQDIVPIICVGENKEVRDRKKHLEFVYKQLIASIPKNTKFTKLVIAYEPIWSIGTGIVPSLDEIREMMKLIRKITKERLQDVAAEFQILYGGSVSAENAKQILTVDNVDGLLVGKASIDAKQFFEICKSASS